MKSLTQGGRNSNGQSDTKQTFLCTSLTRKWVSLAYSRRTIPCVTPQNLYAGIACCQMQFVSLPSIERDNRRSCKGVFSQKCTCFMSSLKGPKTKRGRGRSPYISLSSASSEVLPFLKYVCRSKHLHDLLLFRSKSAESFQRSPFQIYREGD